MPWFGSGIIRIIKPPGKYQNISSLGFSAIKLLKRLPLSLENYSSGTYVSTFASKSEDARTALEYLLQLIKSARRTYSQLNEAITAALNAPEAYYRGASALHMRIAPACRPGLPASLLPPA